jgi:hypothetical protein
MIVAVHNLLETISERTEKAKNSEAMKASINRFTFNFPDDSHRRRSKSYTGSGDGALTWAASGPFRLSGFGINKCSRSRRGRSIGRRRNPISLDDMGTTAFPVPRMAAMISWRQEFTDNADRSSRGRGRSAAMT